MLSIGLSRAIASPCAPRMRKSKAIFKEHNGHTMEAERVNSIGNTLEDLSERTADLRRYL
jgi:hypothetical protein